jgi:hypothetical protein
VANKKAIIREHPITSTINGVKALPFVVRPLGIQRNSIYGVGLCQACMTFNSDVNNLREMLMDAIKRSNTEVIALGGGLDFSGKDFTYDNEFLNFNGQLGGNFQQISGNPPNQAIFTYLERLYKDIAMYTGIDVQNIIGEPQQTAYQTEVQREASQKRMNVWLTNRDLSNSRLAKLKKDCLQTYFPLDKAQRIVKPGEEDKREAPKIEIVDEEYNADANKFIKKKGIKSVFEVTKEALRGDDPNAVNIAVTTNTNEPSISAVKKQQTLDILTSLPQIYEGIAVSDQLGYPLGDVVDVKDLTRELLNDYNIQTKGVEGDNLKEEKEKLIQEIQAIGA